MQLISTDVALVLCNLLPPPTRPPKPKPMDDYATCREYSSGCHVPCRASCLRGRRKRATFHRDFDLSGDGCSRERLRRPKLSARKADRLSLSVVGDLPSGFDLGVPRLEVVTHRLEPRGASAGHPHFDFFSVAARMKANSSISSRLLRFSRKNLVRATRRRSCGRRPRPRGR